MARYIDATRLQAKILDASITNKLPESKEVLKIFDKMVQSIPTADVVPKSEVARGIILEIDTLICCHANGDIDDKNLYIFFDKLKKKYTEGTNE